MKDQQFFMKRFDICESVLSAAEQLSLKISPQYKGLTLRLIKRSLGYLPSPEIYLPHLAFAQSLEDNHANGVIPDDVYAREAVALDERIRNDDMKKGGWVSKLEFDQSDYDFYNEYLEIYKNAARERLCRIMGYEPLLLYSLTAEMLLRHFIESDSYYSEMPMCEVDFKAVTITRYRELYITEGETVADQSGVMGPIFREFEEKNKK